MSTVDEELREDNETKELDDLEKFLREQGINIREELKQHQDVSIIQEKRHYEQEIEVLKRDLEVIEIEEYRIKAKIASEKYPNLPITKAFDNFLEKKDFTLSRPLLNETNSYFTKGRVRRSKYSLKNLPPNSGASPNKDERLNTDLIDQIFEDPQMQS